MLFRDIRPCPQSYPVDLGSDILAEHEDVVPSPQAVLSKLKSQPS